MNTRTRFSPGLYAMAMLYLILISIQPKYAQAKELVLGQVAPFSGPLAPTGNDYRNGVLLRLEEINRGGGIHGNVIRLETRDDGYESPRTVTQTDELIQHAAPLALIGFVGTGNIEALEASGILRRANIALVGVRTGAARKLDPNVFFLRASYRDEVERMVRNAVTIGLKRISVLYQNDPFGKEGLSAARLALAANHLEIVSEGSYEKNTVNVDAAVQSIARGQPQLVIMVSNTAASAQFIRKMREAKQDPSFIAVSVTDAEQLYTLLGADIARGIGVCQVVPSPYSPRTRIASDFRHALDESKLPGLRINFTTLEGYIAATVLLKAVEKAGPNPTRESVIAALDHFGHMSFDNMDIVLAKDQHEATHYTDLSVIGPDGHIMQ
jgi:ABC-type branched-subunit amino acid transport system substrate-binding protein